MVFSGSTCIQRPRLQSTVWLLIITSIAILGTPEPTSAQYSRMAETDAFNKALILFEDGMYSEAELAFRTFEEHQPDHPSAPEARFYRAESLRALGDIDRAVPLYESFKKDYPTHPLRPRALLALGRHLYEGQRYVEARSTLNSIFDSATDTGVAAEATYWLGMASYSMNQTDVALAYFEQVYGRFPDTEVAPTALYMSGKIDLERGRYDTAAEAFSRLSSRYPDSPVSGNVGLALVEANYELGRYEQAVDAAESRLNTLEGANMERALLLLAESSAQLGDIQRALYYTDILSERYPNSPYLPFAFFGKGWALFKNGSFLEAAQAFGVAAGIASPQLAHEASYNQAVSLLNAGRTMDAQEQFLKTVTDSPRGLWANQALFELGVAYYEQQDFESAASTFQRLTLEYPSSPRLGESLLLLGESFAALGDMNRAIQFFDSALQGTSVPDEIRHEIAFRKAWLLYQNQQYGTAQTLFSAHFNATGNSDALFWAAESHFQQNELGAAEQKYRQYVQQFTSGPKAAAAHYALGWIFFKQSKYLEASRSFRTFVDSFAGSPEQQFYITDARLRIADSYYALRRFDDAIVEYRRVGAAGTVYALYQIGQSHVNGGEDEEALNAFRRIVGNYPNSEWAPEAQYAIGYIYLQRQDNVRARQEYSRVISNFPGSAQAPRAQYGIGDAYFNENQFTQAIEAYRQVLTRYPESQVVPDALQGIQFASLAAGTPDVADSIIGDFVRSNPNSPLIDEVRFRQAETKVQNGNFDEAITLLNSLSRRDLDGDLMPAVLFYLGLSHASLNSPNQAEPFFKQVIREFPTSPFAVQATQRLGVLFMDSGNFSSAYQTYRDLERLGSGDNSIVAEAMYGQALALLAQGQLTQGEELLQRLISMYPNTQESRRARLRLANLYIQNNQGNRATQIYLDLASGNDDVAVESLYRYATLLLQNQDFIGALREYQNIPSRFDGYLDWVAQSYLGQARAFRALNRIPEAIRAYDIVINDHYDSPFAQIAQDEKSSL